MRAATLRRAGSGVAAPLSGDGSLSSGTDIVYQRRRRKRQQRRQHKPDSWALVIRILLIVAGLLATFDLVLFVHKTHRTSQAFKLDSSEQQQQHEFVERAPPIRGDDDDTILHENENVDEDKEPIYEILRQANIDPSTLDDETKRQLPTWTTVQRLYGKEPRIYGLDTCDKFREIVSVEPSLTFYAMAGAFNSGTNLLAELMIQNCQITARMKKYGEKQKGMRWQVKWGKHTPPKYRQQHVTSTDKDVPVEYTLPLITIRDPYNWMQSMCRHQYEAHWNHEHSCPHVWNEETGRTSRVQVNYAEARTHHESLPDFWNDWYNAYMDVEWPRVLVRMEDLIFYGKNVTETLCACGGGDKRRNQFKHISKSAKLGTAQHGSDKTTLLEAIIRYGNDDKRLTSMTEKDLEVTREILDPNLMHIFNYQYA